MAPGVDGAGGRGAGDGAGEARHPSRPQASRLAPASIFCGALCRCRWIKRHRFARRNLSASPTSLWLDGVNPELESGVVFSCWLEHFFQRSVCACGGQVDLTLQVTRIDVESARAI